MPLKACMTGLSHLHDQIESLAQIGSAEQPHNYICTLTPTSCILNFLLCKLMHKSLDKSIPVICAKQMLEVDFGEGETYNPCLK